MEINEQALKQVHCQACGESMSAHNFKCSHTAYCAIRVQEVDKPKAIPAPKKIIPKVNKMLPAKEVNQAEESYNDAAELFKGSSLASGDTYINEMTQLKHQITKAQEEYKSNNKQPDLPMCKHSDFQRPEDILPPTYAVILQNPRMKKQKKDDKLTSKAF